MTPGPSAGATVVAVGSGAAGLSAALAAAEAAGRGAAGCRVVLVERAGRGRHGGNTRWSPSYMRMAAPDCVAPGFEADVRARLGRAAGAGAVARLLGMAG